MKILKFEASWCMPCKQLDRILATIPDIKVEHYDVEDHEEMATSYNIRNVPVLVFVDDDNNELARLRGVVPKSKIEETYKECLNGISNNLEN